MITETVAKDTSVCEVCGKPKTLHLLRTGLDAVVHVACDCERNEIARYEEAARRKQQEMRIASIPANRFGIDVSAEAQFEGSCDEKRGFRLVRSYANRWEEVSAGGFGLLLVGAPGTGKTFAAECLVNELRRRGFAVLMTSVERSESVLWDIKGEEQLKALDSLARFDLIVIDDLGAERETAYMDSKAFTLIDACYRSRAPLVVTTNIPLSQIKGAKGLARTRIYDRVLERCQPVVFEGESFRARKAAAQRDELRAILNAGNR